MRNNSKSKSKEKAKNKKGQQPNTKSAFISFDINKILHRNNSSSNQNKQKTCGILQMKPIENTNAFLSSLSNYTLNLNELNKDTSQISLKAYQDHQDRITDFCVLPEYSAMASTSKDLTVKIFDLKGSTANVKSFSLKQGNEPYCVAYSDNSLLFGAGKRLIISDMRNLSSTSKVSFLHSDVIRSIRMRDLNGISLVITCGEDNIVNVINYTAREIDHCNVLNILNTNQAAVLADILDSKGNYVYVINVSEEFCIYDVYTSKRVFMFDCKGSSYGVDYLVNVEVVHDLSVLIGCGNYR